MIEVTGFRGLTFDSPKVGTQDLVVTPPYDVISAEERSHLAAQSPYNMVHLLLPQTEQGDPYAVAGETMEAWLETGALRQDEEPSLYLLRQQFEDMKGVHHSRCAFFCAVRLPETGSKKVLGHERTFSTTVSDRLDLMRSTKANLGAIFSLYPDPEGALKPFLNQMNERPADGAAHTIDGVKQEFWRVGHDPKVTEFLADKTLYIADGHHRFQTACAYRDEMHAKENPTTLQPYDYILMGLVAFEDSGLQIYPPHRLVQKPEGFVIDDFLNALEKHFEVTPVLSGLPQQVEEAPGACVMGMAIHGKGNFLLTLKDLDRCEFLGEDHGPSWRDLDVAVLHRGIIENILQMQETTIFEYEKNAARAISAAHEGEVGIAFILRAVRPDQMRACAEAGESMPPKSTYFFPKLPSGVVIHRLV